MTIPIMAPSARIVGNLACQKNSYPRTLETQVVSCAQLTNLPPNFTSGKIKRPGKGHAESGTTLLNWWIVECVDSVLFPEGGGQPSDHGTLELISDTNAHPVPIEYVQRQGLRCFLYSPQPFTPGDRVRQVINFDRRWDFMQQLTGQHLLSATMETFDGLDTIGWGMGGEGAMNYVDLPRRSTSEELEMIQKRCNRVIQDNLPITVDLTDSDNSESLTEDYDKQNGVVRVIHIEGVDRNPCCGTHLSQTSHISIVLLHSGHFVRKTNYRQYFTAGERAIGMSMNAINGLELAGKILGCGSSPDTLVKEAKRLVGLSKELKRRERKLLMEISNQEGKKAKARIESGSNVFLHRADGGLEFINGTLARVDESARNNGRVILVAVGTEKAGGPVVVAGEIRAVEACVAGIKRILPEIKGGGAPGKWQGKVLNWDKDCFSRFQGLVEEL